MLFDLTNPQKAIWLTEQFYKGKSINNICATLTINQLIDIEKLSKAINIFIKSNKSFSIKLKLVDSEPKQYFSALSDLSFQVYELENNKSIKQLALETSNELFNIETDYLFKFKLYHLKNGYGGFVVMLHHLIGDAATMSIIGKQIVDIYSHLVDRTRLYCQGIFL